MYGCTQVQLYVSPGKACTVNALLSVNSQNIFLKNSIENLGIRSGSYNGRTSVSIEIAEMSHQHQQFKLFFTVDEFSKLLSKTKKKQKNEIRLIKETNPY